MESFDLHRISLLTKAFIKGNQRLSYQLEKLEEDNRHVLYQATNLFSLLYFQVTADTHLIKQWTSLQKTLFQNDRSKANRFLVYLVPDSLVRDSDLYGELTRAERDDKFFRKVFIGLPDNADKQQIESSLAERIPLWFEERDKVVRQYVPVLTDLIPDANLIKILLEKTPSTTVRALEEQKRFAYLFEKEARVGLTGKGVAETTSAVAGLERGARITQLEVSNFRRFERKSIDLDGDVVIIYGRNGTGKTTLSDALELTIFPELQRLRGDPDLAQKPGCVSYAPFIWANSEADHAHISVRGKVGVESFCLETKIHRTGIEKQLNNRTTTNEDVLKFLTRNEDVMKDGFLDILLHTHFLGQHSIRDFIYGNRLESDEKITTSRYNLLAEMFGFGEVEGLKKRLTNLLAQIKRSRITKADHQIEGIRSQIRGLKQKYGPKCHQSLQKAGYRIELKAAAEQYSLLMQRLPDLLADHQPEALTLEGCDDANTYRSACVHIHSVLALRVKRLEAEASDLRSLGRLVAKLSAILPTLKLSGPQTVSSVIAKVRQTIANSIEVVQGSQRELHKIETHAHTLHVNKANLERFCNQFDHYARLLTIELNEAEKLASIQKSKSALIEKQNALAATLETAAVDERRLQQHADKSQELVHKCERLVKSLTEARTAEITLKHVTTKLERISVAIAQDQQALSNLNVRTQSATSSGSSEGSILNLEPLKSDSHYSCPCCGAIYDELEKLEQGIQQQLASGTWSQELHDFLVGLQRKSLETTRQLLLDKISAQVQEKGTLEQNRKEQERILSSFKSLVSDLGLTSDVSEMDLRQMAQKHQQELETSRQRLGHHEAVALRSRLEQVRAELETASDDTHKKQLAQIREDLLELTRPLTDIVPAAELRKQSGIKARLSKLSSESDELTSRKQRLLKDIASRSISDEQQRELDNAVSAIESLLLKQESLNGYLPIQSSTLGAQNLNALTACHKLSKESDDLAKLFGFLSAEESSDTLKNGLVEHEQEKQRWKDCYRSIEAINASLSRITASGLEQSLGQYGPLINQVYQKFIRHDVFAALVLQPKASRKGRKRDLYLKLESYTGGTEYTPASYLSEAQLNILALSIFLTRVMYQNISALKTILIDDPIQQMDDVNAAAFVDVILGLSNVGKQIIITTCNYEFFRLVSHKMRDLHSIKFKAVNLDLPGSVP